MLLDYLNEKIILLIKNDWEEYMNNKEKINTDTAIVLTTAVMILSFMLSLAMYSNIF